MTTKSVGDPVPTPGLTCPYCDTETIVTVQYDTTIPYGYPQSVDISVRLPARCCTVCDAKYLDHEAESVKDRRIRQWLRQRHEMV